ncbi:hypothetical protein ACQU0X_27185 [Pseudovibrio ascidiaceicola]|uniref:hypothetical protein n=1 Tax=Pseudovibrio ascidiaceicola TaxID=285279 RepID=UPI003D362995
MRNEAQLSLYGIVNHVQQERHLVWWGKLSDEARYHYILKFALKVDKSRGQVIVKAEKDIAYAAYFDRLEKSSRSLCAAPAQVVQPLPALCP